MFWPPKAETCRFIIKIPYISCNKLFSNSCLVINLNYYKFVVLNVHTLLFSILISTTGMIHLNNNLFSFILIQYTTKIKAHQWMCYGHQKCYPDPSSGVRCYVVWQTFYFITWHHIPQDYSVLPWEPQVSHSDAFVWLLPSFYWECTTMTVCQASHFWIQTALLPSWSQGASACSST